MHFSVMYRLGYIDITGRLAAVVRQTSAGWGMRQNHSPGGSTAAAFFSGVIFRVSIRKKQV